MNNKLVSHKFGIGICVATILAFILFILLDWIPWYSSLTIILIVIGLFFSFVSIIEKFRICNLKISFNENQPTMRANYGESLLILECKNIGTAMANNCRFRILFPPSIEVKKALAVNRDLKVTNHKNSDNTHIIKLNCDLDMNEVELINVQINTNKAGKLKITYECGSNQISGFTDVLYLDVAAKQL